MEIFEAIQKRHSVRNYTDQKIEAPVRSALKQEIDSCNRESGLNIQLIPDEPEAFSSFLAHYGRFSGVRNYIALVGAKTADLSEKIGYYGERIVLKAVTLGLDTCWVAMSFGKRKSESNCLIRRGEKLVCVIAVGYGQTHGAAHKNKPIKALYKAEAQAPDWFLAGVRAASLAPTAMNRQKFQFQLLGANSVRAVSAGRLYAKIDLGIVKYHFEIGAGKENFHWI
ncbi:MAG: nitroreductase family protein [Clostridia bacterium]